MKMKRKKPEKVKLPKGFKLVDDFLSKEEIEALENDTTMRDPIIITGGHESETRSKQWTQSNAKLQPQAFHIKPM